MKIGIGYNIILLLVVTFNPRPVLGHNMVVYCYCWKGLFKLSFLVSLFLHHIPVFMPSAMSLLSDYN